MGSVDVNLVTWPNHPKRLEYFHETVDAIRRHMTASRHDIRFYCSAESERDSRHMWFGTSLETYCQCQDIELHWRSARANLGANMNAALRLGNSPTVLLVQDDWLLLRDLDLSPGVEFMERGGADLLRYSFPDIDTMRPMFYEQGDGWLRIDLTSTWIYGDDPHLRRRDFMDTWGWYLEGGGHGMASATLMQTLRCLCADIAVADRASYFRHFGDVTAVLDDKRNRRITR
jgi:hypothetical protein